MNQSASFEVPNLYEARLKRQNVRIRQRKGCRSAFPGDFPVGTRSPSIAIHEEGKVSVVKQEFSVQPLHVDWLDVFLLRNEVEGSVSLVKEGLSFGCFQADNFEALRTTNTKSRPKEVNGRRFRGNVELLFERLEAISGAHGSKQ